MRLADIRQLYDYCMDRITMKLVDFDDAVQLRNHPTNNVSKAQIYSRASLTRWLNEHQYRDYNGVVLNEQARTLTSAKRAILIAVVAMSDEITAARESDNHEIAAPYLEGGEFYQEAEEIIAWYSSRNSGVGIWQNYDVKQAKLDLIQLKSLEEGATLAPINLEPIKIGARHLFPLFFNLDGLDSNTASIWKRCNVHVFDYTSKPLHGFIVENNRYNCISKNNESNNKIQSEIDEVIKNMTLRLDEQSRVEAEGLGPDKTEIAQAENNHEVIKNVHKRCQERFLKAQNLMNTNVEGRDKAFQAKLLLDQLALLMKQSENSIEQVKHYMRKNQEISELIKKLEGELHASRGKNEDELRAWNSRLFEAPILAYDTKNGYFEVVDEKHKEISRQLTKADTTFKTELKSWVELRQIATQAIRNIKIIKSNALSICRVFESIVSPYIQIDALQPQLRSISDPVLPVALTPSFSSSSSLSSSTASSLMTTSSSSTVSTRTSSSRLSSAASTSSVSAHNPAARMLEEFKDNARKRKENRK